jgi:ABC-2 type transport system permease protein
VSAHVAETRAATLSRGAGGSGAGAAGALRAEWTKSWTVPGTGWLLAATVGLTAAVSALAAASTRCPAGLSCPVDTTKLSLTGVQFAQAVVAIMAVLAISGEYSTGMIRTTLAATPRRQAVLAAKAMVLTGQVLAAGTVAVLASLLAGGLILPGHGFTTGRGFQVISLADGPVLRAAAGSVLYLALIGLLALGVATVVRDPAPAIGTVLGLLYLLPLIVVFLGANPVWQRRFDRYTPASAGLAIQDTTGLRHLPIGPWEGLGVLAIWAGAALLAGGLLLWRRDA